MATLGFGLAGPRLITLITLPLAYATLGAETAGRLVLIEASTIYIPVLGGWAFAAYAQRFVATRAADRIVGVWRSSLGVSMTFAAVAVAAVWLISPPAIGLWLAAILASFLQGAFPGWVLQGLREFRAYRRGTAIQVTVAVITAVAGLTAGWAPAYFLSAALGYVVAYAAVASSRLALRPEGDLRLLREGILFIPSQVAIQAYISADIILVRIFLGLTATGVYGAIYRIQYGLMALYAVLQQYLTFRIKHHTDMRERSVRRWLWFGALGVQWTLLLVLGLTHLRLPEPLSEWWYVPVVLCGQFSLATIGLLPVLRTLIGPPHQYAAITLLGMSTNIALNCLLIPSTGLVGAALATALSEALVVTSAAWLTGRLTAMLALAMAAALAVPVSLFVAFLPR